MLRRLRPVFYLLGVALVIGSLVGARALTGDGKAADSKTANPAANGAKAGGLIVLGTVDSTPSKVSYGLPPMLPSGTISAVFVKEGQEVKKGDKAKGIPGDKLYEFDSSLQKHDLALAKIAVLQAQNELAKANEAKKQHDAKVEIMKQAVALAADKTKWHESHHKLVKGNLEQGYKAQGKAESEWPELMAINEQLYKANIDWNVAARELKLKQAELAALEAVDAQLLVKQAEIGIKQTQEVQEKAQTAVDKCTVWAQSDGTVEQLKISEGTTLGISTRDPALWLIPGGKRVVRAEVEAEFAHRVTDDLEGKEVTIADHTDPKLTYKGIVKRIPRTFLPKRSNEGFLGNDTQVLEVPIEVIDATPAGKPPLRVGQRVRVNLGQ
jgi:multidrug resistance efflux pump